MKKLLITFMFVVVLSHPIFAATSNDIHENLYLRQDVFEAKMDAFMAEIKLMNQNMRSEFKQDIQDMRSELKQEIHELSKAIAVLSERTDRNFDILSARIEGTNSRIDDLRNGMYLWLVIIGTFITLVSVVIAWPRAKNFIQNRASQKQSFTLDDIEKLIDARINSKFHS